MSPTDPTRNLADRIARLSAADRLVMAASLLCEGKDDLAITIAEQVVLEHQLQHLRNLPKVDA